MDEERKEKGGGGGGPSEALRLWSRRYATSHGDKSNSHWCTLDMSSSHSISKLSSVSEAFILVLTWREREKKFLLLSIRLFVGIFFALYYWEKKYFSNIVKMDLCFLKCFGDLPNNTNCFLLMKRAGIYAEGKYIKGTPFFSPFCFLNDDIRRAQNYCWPEVVHCLTFLEWR